MSGWLCSCWLYPENIKWCQGNHILKKLSGWFCWVSTPLLPHLTPQFLHWSHYEILDGKDSVQDFFLVFMWLHHLDVGKMSVQLRCMDVEMTDWWLTEKGKKMALAVSIINFYLISPPSPCSHTVPICYKFWNVWQIYSFHMLKCNHWYANKISKKWHTH